MEDKKDPLKACGGCTAHDHDSKHQPVPYIVHERDMARMERNNKRLWILCIVMFLAFVISNGLWMHYESQFEDVVTETQTVTQDTGSGIGDNNFNGDFYGGDYNGVSKDYKDEN